MTVYTLRHSQQSDQGLYYLIFSAVWSRSTLSFWAVWSGSTLFAIRSSLIKVKVHSHPQEQSDQGLHYLPFSDVWSWSTLFPILSKQYYKGLHCLPFSAVWLGSTLIVSLSSLIRVYTVSHSQQSDQGLHYLPFTVWSGSILFSILSRQYYQCLHCFIYSAVWSGSTPLAILSSLIKVKIYTVIFRNSLIRVYIICHSQHSDQGLHYYPFSAVWSGSTQFAIHNSLIIVYTVILSSLIRVFTVCNSQ